MGKYNSANFFYNSFFSSCERTQLRIALSVKEAMKLFGLIGLIVVLSACQDEDVKFPDLDVGNYQLKIFDQHGQKVLTRRGKATGLGTHSQVIMEDPEFVTHAEKDSMDVFASLWLFTDKVYELTWNNGSLWHISPDEAGAFLIQRQYGSSSDWQYESVSGEIRILESTNNVLKGHFRINMTVTQPDENNPGMMWRANPKWGDSIVVQGYFASKDW